MVSDGSNNGETPDFSLGSPAQIETDSSGLPFIPDLDTLPDPSLLPQVFIDASLGVNAIPQIPLEGSHINNPSQQQPQALNPPAEANHFFELAQYQNPQGLQTQNFTSSNASQRQENQNEEPQSENPQAIATVANNSVFPMPMDVEEPLQISQNVSQSCHNSNHESMDLGSDRPSASPYDPLESTPSAISSLDINTFFEDSEALPSNLVETSNNDHNDMDIEQADAQDTVGSLPSPHVCQVCQDAFSSIQMLLRHRADVHPDAKPYLCMICGYSCLVRRVMSTHFVNIHGGETSDCIQCNARLQTPAGLQKHMHDKHEEGKEDNCPECERHFKTKSGLRRHRKQMHNVGNLENDAAENEAQESDRPESDDAILPASVEISCQVCKENCSSELLLRQHRADVHPDKEPFICIDCGKEYKTRAKLNSHYIAFHKKSGLLRCFGCTKLYQTITGRENHYQLEHLQKQSYACPDCSYRFAKPYTLRKHEMDKKHGQFAPLFTPDGSGSYGKENYPLPETGPEQQENEPLPDNGAEGQENDPQAEIRAADEVNESLAANATTGTENATEAPTADALTCRTCSETFEDAKSLWHHHADRHPEERPFYCLECGYVFNERYLLRRHCGGEHSYGLLRCRACEQIFQTAAGLEKHAEKHDRQPFRCDDCGRRYQSRESLHRHQKQKSHGPLFSN